MRTWITPARRPAALLAVTLAGLAASVARALWRREPGVDLIALLAMGGALALGEELAGAVIAVMLASGRLLRPMRGTGPGGS